MYSFIGQIPAASITSSTGGYSHSPSSVHWAVIPAVRRAAQWWKPSNTFRIYLINTQSCSHIVVPSASPLYKSSHGPAPLLPSLSETLISPPSAAKPSTGCDTWSTDRYYYTQWCGRSKESHPQVLVSPYKPKCRPKFPQNSVAGSPSVSVLPLQAGTYPTRSGDC